MNSSTVQCFVLIIVSLCVCYEQFNSSVLCIDYSFSLCVMNSSTVQYFVLTIVSLCVCYEQFNSSVYFVLTIVSLCVCYEQFNSSVFCIDYSFSLLRHEQFNSSLLCIDYSFSLCVMNSSTVQCFVLIIVSLCVCYEQFKFIVQCFVLIININSSTVFVLL